MKRLVTLALFSSLVLSPQSASAQAVGGQSATASRSSENVAQVWSREADYWRFVRAGDVNSYVSLWHDRFIGWPCGEKHPMRKESIGDWVREIREKHINVTSDLTHDGAEDFGNIVVVHYRFTRVDTYPDGHVEGKAKSRRSPTHG